MTRRPRIDWVNWKLYRRAFAPPILALIVVLATSFRPDVTLPQAAPSFDGAAAQGVVASARAFAHRFPDRRPGSATSLDAAQYVSAQFTAAGLKTRLAPDTAVLPNGHRSIGIVNVEATLPGRSPQAVVFTAPRDESAVGGRSSATDTAALLSLAKRLSLDQDRRRTYLFVSTDASTVGGGGARSLAHQLAGQAVAPFAVISIEGIGDGAALHVPVIAASDRVSPLGLTATTQSAVQAEGGSAAPPSVPSQLLRLGTPVSLLEQAQFTRLGVPATAISGVREDTTGALQGDGSSVDGVGAAMRSLLRVSDALDGLDALQSAGKTYVETSQRVYRGWALKVLLASLLLPVWAAAVGLLLRGRHTWNIAAAIGSIARAMIAGLWALVSLWLVGATHLIPVAGDLPPNPRGLDGAPVAGIVVWLILAAAGWLIARGPDWRYAVRGPATGDAAPAPDHAVQAAGVLVLSLLAVPVLAIDPYALVPLLPSLHIWLLLSSRLTPTRLHRGLAWAAGLIPALIVALWLGSEFGLGADTGWYLLDLARTRSVDPMLLLVEALGAGVSLLLLVASQGQLAHPLLHRVLGRSGGLADTPWSFPRTSARAGAVIAALRGAGGSVAGAASAARAARPAAPRRAHGEARRPRRSAPSERGARPGMTAAERSALRSARRDEQRSSGDASATRNPTKTR